MWFCVVLCSFPACGVQAGRSSKRRKIEEMTWSYCVEQLLTLVGRGRIDISCATDIARAVLQDGVENETVSKLASLGAFGDCQSKCERDLHTWLRNLFGLQLQAYSIDVPLKVG